VTTRGLKTILRIHRIFWCLISIISYFLLSEKLIIKTALEEKGLLRGFFK